VLGELRRHSGAQILQVGEKLNLLVDVLQGEFTEEQADPHYFGIEVAETTVIHGAKTWLMTR
jgi:hypothetical protein